MNYTQNRGRFNPQQRFSGRPKRAPLPEGFSLFYLAINCPPEIDSKIEILKDYMQVKYGCKAARKSPAHLTIVPPFRAEDEMEQELLNFVTTYNIGIVPFEISIKSFGQFGNRVLFVNVEGPNDALNTLEKECMAEFGEKYPGIIFGMKPEFNPHVTIATRDIPEGAIDAAKSYFEANHPVAESFIASELSLFRLEDGWWKKVE
jgi:2'-5' RNA ligase